MLIVAVMFALYSAHGVSCQGKHPSSYMTIQNSKSDPTDILHEPFLLSALTTRGRVERRQE